MFEGLKILRKARSFAMRNIMGTASSVSTSEPIVALTFDDGPHPEFTPRLLEILKKYGASATFFVVGKVAERHRELIERIAEGGHAIGNHSWNHRSFPWITGHERRRQLRACHKAIAPYGKHLFRPPYGHQNLACRLDAFLLGYKVITWDVVAEDWLDHNAERMFENVLDKIHPGSIILFHDALYTVIEHSYCNREPTLKAVDMLLDRLGEQFRFVTVPELLKKGRVQKQSWYQRGNDEWLSKLKEAVA